MKHLTEEVSFYWTKHLPDEASFYWTKHLQDEVSFYWTKHLPDEVHQFTTEWREYWIKIVIKYVTRKIPNKWFLLVSGDVKSSRGSMPTYPPILDAIIHYSSTQIVLLS